LNCDRLIIARTATTSEYVNAGAASYYYMTTEVQVVAFDLFTGEKCHQKALRLSGECSVFTGQRGFRQDLVKDCVAGIIDEMAGSN
jgi:hypothetical protein